VIVARIQAHPAREDLHGPLTASLAPLETEVFVHSSDPPNPWEGYRRCLSDIPECSHLLILQDDALPCASFPVALEQVAERHPSTPVCLFLGAAPASTAGLARKAMMRQRRYIPLMNTNFVPLVAVLWPRQVAQEFLEWSETTTRKMTRADDGNAARFMRDTRQPFMVSVPSLVEHNDFIPSVKGGASKPRQHKPGKSWRSAALLAEDASLYEW
jgi:hypothetical protein